MKKAILKTSRIYYSYCVLFEAGNNALEAAKKNYEGSFYHILTAMLYSAFSLEAYLNHLGRIQFVNWSEMERWGPKRKLKEVTERIGLIVSYDCRPFETFNEIIDFRNSVVHAKTEHISSTEHVVEIEIESVPELPMPEWDKKFLWKMVSALLLIPKK